MALRSPSNHLPEFEEGLSHFAVLGIPETLGMDLDSLRERFYDLSRQTHPDRFATAEPLEALKAARWSTAVNRAYQTLRDPIARAEYLLDLYAGNRSTPPVPLELAESYFDLQDALLEPGGEANLAVFRADLTERLRALDAAWPELERTWDDAADKKSVVEPLIKHLTLRRFLHSMLADIAKKETTP